MWPGRAVKINSPGRSTGNRIIFKYRLIVEDNRRIPEFTYSGRLVEGLALVQLPGVKLGGCKEEDSTSRIGIL